MSINGWAAVVGAAVALWIAGGITYQIGQRTGERNAIDREARERRSHEILVLQQQALNSRPTEEICQEVLRESAEDMVREMIHSGEAAEVCEAVLYDPRQDGDSLDWSEYYARRGG
ncbi:MAG: hypothetical protein LCH92_08305 [Proteobacteria bacterium]|nr:hypothetical protein [Pseudomonadota bacterium]